MFLFVCLCFVCPTSVGTQYHLITNRKKRTFVFFHSQGIESRLKVTLPDDLPASLADGVVLCHLINHIRKGMIPSIHIPSAGVVRAHCFVAVFALMREGM